MLEKASSESPTFCVGVCFRQLWIGVQVANREGNAQKKIMTDITIYITDRDGTEHEIIAPTDMNMNLMEVIRSYELAEEGTIGVCGGMAMCASCQCYIESDHELDEMSADEDLMLAEAFHVAENSRLGCQIFIAENLNGLKVKMAPYDD